MQPMFVYFDAPEEIVLRALKNLDLTTVVDINAEDEASRRGVTYAEVATLIDEGFPYTGPIDYVSNTVDAATGTIQVRAVLPNTEMNLFPGLFVRVRIPMGILENAVLIREEALGTDLGGRYVYVVGEGNVVEQRYVELGPVEPDGMVPITEGLDGTETYVVEGMLRARPGMPVTPDTMANTPEATAPVEPETAQVETAGEDG
jgi:RND family efflux transporter MFP subunit